MVNSDCFHHTLQAIQSKPPPGHCVTIKALSKWDILDNGHMPSMGGWMDGAHKTASTVYHACNNFKV